MGIEGYSSQGQMRGNSGFPPWGVNPSNLCPGGGQFRPPKVLKAYLKIDESRTAKHGLAAHHSIWQILTKVCDEVMAGQVTRPHLLAMP